MVVLCQGVSVFLKRVSHTPSVSEERHLMCRMSQDVAGPGFASMEAPVSLLALGSKRLFLQAQQNTPSLAPALGWGGWLRNMIQEIGSIKA